MALWKFNPFTGRKLKRRVKNRSKAARRITGRYKRRSTRGKRR